MLTKKTWTFGYLHWIVLFRLGCIVLSWLNCNFGLSEKVGCKCKELKIHIELSISPITWEKKQERDDEGEGAVHDIGGGWVQHLKEGNQMWVVCICMCICICVCICICIFICIFCVCIRGGIRDLYLCFSFSLHLYLIFLFDICIWYLYLCLYFVFA